MLNVLGGAVVGAGQGVGEGAACQGATWSQGAVLFVGFSPGAVAGVGPHSA